MLNKYWIQEGKQPVRSIGLPFTHNRSAHRILPEG